ncbi:MAG: hypothetical protein AB7F74_22760 [Parvibaculaceae bacterium]
MTTVQEDIAKTRGLVRPSLEKIHAKNAAAQRARGESEEFVRAVREECEREVMNAVIDAVFEMHDQ